MALVRLLDMVFGDGADPAPDAPALVAPDVTVTRAELRAEVKALREAKVQLADSYARLVDGEVWCFGIGITAYSHASTQVPPEPLRDRKLLLHRGQIDVIRDRTTRERLSLVPLSMYFKGSHVKLELALGRGRRQVDKRQAIATRDADMEARRAMARGAARAARPD